MSPSDTSARVRVACVAVRLTQSDAEHGCGGASMNTQRCGINFPDLTRLLERLRPLDFEGWFAVAIARLERGDVEGGLRAAEGAFDDMVDRYDDMVNTHEEGDQ